MSGFGREFINVKDLPPAMRAIGNGFIDDRLAIRGAILALPIVGGVPTGTLYFPPGVYRIAVPEVISSLPFVGGPSIDYFVPPVPGAPHFRGVYGRRALLVPPAVRLWFAPGARLALDQYAVVEIAGPLDAGLHQIFEAGRPDDPRGVVVFSTSGGVVRVPLPGVPADGLVRTVYPEWWGAGVARDQTTPPSADADALLAALDAAYSNRVYYPFGDLDPTSIPPESESYAQLPASPPVRFPSLEVVLSGTYEINGPLDVGQPAFLSVPGFVPPAMPFLPTADPNGFSPNSESLLIRGFAGPLQQSAPTSTIRCAPDASPDAFAMLTLRGVAGATVEGVAFDGAGLARSCLDIEYAPPAELLNERDPGPVGSVAAGPTVIAAMMSFARCSFAGARSEQVRVGNAPAVRTTGGSTVALPAGTTLVPAGAPAPLLPGNADVAGLTFEQCVFAPREVPVVTPVAPIVVVPAETARGIYGVLLRASLTVGVQFTSCRFEGQAAAMIMAYGGVFNLMACTFANRLEPRYVPLDAAEALDTGSGPSLPRAGRPLIGFPNAVDIYLERPPLEGTTERFLASFTASHCESSSGQFLATFVGRANPSTFPFGFSTAGVSLSGALPVAQGPKRKSVLMAVQHRRGPLPGGGRVATSVYWGDAGELELIACSMRAIRVQRGARVSLLDTVSSRVDWAQREDVRVYRVRAPAVLSAADDPQQSGLPAGLEQLYATTVSSG